MWKIITTFGIAVLGSIECFPGKAGYDLTSLAFDEGEIISVIPSLETGAKVAKWKPEDGVNPEELGETYLEGDIIMTHKTRNGLKSESSRWKNGIVPYKISDKFNYKDYNTIMSAIEEYHKLTCVKWVRWSGEADYVYFVPGNTGCWSSVGRVGGMQELNLQTPGCLTKKGTVIHEMLHALGFLHEQNRHERDDYVTINYQNIQRVPLPNIPSEREYIGNNLIWTILGAPAMLVTCRTRRENNFEKASADTTDNQGVPYDYRSVMHYSANAFSSNGKPTIVPKVNVELGQREGLSRGDIKKIRAMYKCGADGA